MGDWTIEEWVKELRKGYRTGVHIGSTGCRDLVKLLTGLAAHQPRCQWRGVDGDEPMCGELACEASVGLGYRCKLHPHTTPSIETGEHQDTVALRRVDNAIAEHSYYDDDGALMVNVRYLNEALGAKTGEHPGPFVSGKNFETREIKEGMNKKGGLRSKPTSSRPAPPAPHRPAESDLAPVPEKRLVCQECGDGDPDSDVQHRGDFVMCEPCWEHRVSSSTLTPE